MVWLIHMYDITHSYVRHEVVAEVIYDQQLCIFTNENVMSHVWMNHVIYVDKSITHTTVQQKRFQQLAIHKSMQNPHTWIIHAILLICRLVEERKARPKCDMLKSVTLGYRCRLIFRRPGDIRNIRVHTCSECAQPPPPSLPSLRTHKRNRSKNLLEKNKTHLITLFAHRPSIKGTELLFIVIKASSSSGRRMIGSSLKRMRRYASGVSEWF